jgi:hypothetical protein
MNAPVSGDNKTIDPMVSKDGAHTPRYRKHQPMSQQAAAKQTMDARRCLTLKRALMPRILQRAYELH